MRLFIFGLGYTGSRFALAMRGEASWIGGTVRAVGDALHLAAQGLRPSIFDGTHPGIGVAEAVRQATHVVVSIPPSAAAGDAIDPVLALHRSSLLTAGHLQWIGYLSTVGVYGDAGGGWVDETAEPKPGGERSRARLAAEQAWQALAAERGVALAVLRLAGIYGPGRNALVNLAEGTAHRIVKPGQVFNRIHLDDIVTVLGAAAKPNAAGILNVTDDEPALPQDVVAFAARLMGIAPPSEVPFEKAALSPMARSFYGENKRVRNARLSRDLGVTLRYPTYREGLTALWRDGTWRG
jgi:nucleoside-diphosphate-sugar epimerase